MKFTMPKRQYKSYQSMKLIVDCSRWELKWQKRPLLPDQLRFWMKFWRKFF